MKARNSGTDYGLQTLLDSDGEIYSITNGYWVKIEARKVTPTEHIPYGIKYSLTLHDKHNERIIGYDNAHDCLPKTSNYRAKKITWDHVHKKYKVSFYEFSTAGQLMEDFWKAVDPFVK
jgi:hypothetical protein